MKKIQVKINGKVVEIPEHSIETTKTKNKLTQITEGVLTLGLKDEAMEALSESRLEFCKVCPLMEQKGGRMFCSSGKSVETIVDAAKGLTKKTYGCGCVLAIKTRSSASSCPLGKWNPVDKDNYKNQYKLNKDKQ